MKILIHIDGGARGNPGPAGAGVVLHDESGRPILEAGYFLGRMTNNQAEYTALLCSLHAARRAGAAELAIRADSELLVRQIKGVYKVKNPGLKALYDDARRRLRDFKHWEISHVRREANSRADELANAAMDAGEDVVELDIAGTTARTPAPNPRTAAPPPPTRKSRNPALSQASLFTSSIEVRCVRPPDPAACPAPCAGDASYRFVHTVPEGICLHAAESVLPAVEASRRTGKSRLVPCNHDACGAEFEVRPGEATNP